MIRDAREGYIREQHETQIVRGDKNDIVHSDILVANIWKVSVGTTMEIIFAWEMGRKVYLIDPHQPRVLSPWLTYHSHQIFDSVDAVIEFLKGETC